VGVRGYGEKKKPDSFQFWMIGLFCFKGVKKKRVSEGRKEILYYVCPRA